MHKSRLAGLIIDSNTDDLEKEAEFWGATLGLATHRSNEPQEQKYVALKTAANDLYLEVQQVDHESRVHLDIETDNIDAEADRLEKLGAKRVGPVKEWYVMQAPGGQRFCLVTPQRAGFDEEANVWP